MSLTTFVRLVEWALIGFTFAYFAFQVVRYIAS